MASKRALERAIMISMAALVRGVKWGNWSKAWLLARDVKRAAFKLDLKTVATKDKDCPVHELGIMEALRDCDDRT